MPLDEERQRGWKQTLVTDALQRIGHSDVVVEPVRASPRSLGYRNKVEFTLGRDADGQPAVGLHSDDPEQQGIVDVDRCPIQTDAANAVLATAREFLLARSDSWLEASAKTEPFRLILRSSHHDGRVLVVLRETGVPFPDAEALAERLQEVHSNLAGVVRLRGRAGQRGGTRAVPVRGRSSIDERIGEMTFRLPAASFLQVNTEAAGLLLDVVCDGAGDVGGSKVIDLYAGVGVFGIELARRGAEVIACDADLDAVRCGRRAAARMAAGRVAFHHADAAAFLRRFLDERRAADLVVANPPRAGLGRGVAEQIAAAGAKRVVLVACDPATLARDTGRLVQAGFSPLHAVPVDVFPQTAHIETVLVLTR
jgi:23S rRNA (uracil1939-C5)-methyltransferase